MSGHSKWSTIKRKKGKSDAQRAKIFTKISREISVAVREGGGDPTINGRLRDLISKAKSNNVPNDNIDRVIKKASGSGDKDNYESIVYEGYGPSGVAVIVESLTDNKNRTAADVRHYFDKYGGNLGTPGCVSFMFEEKGIIIIEKKDGLDEDKLMEDALDASADDFIVEDAIEIVTKPANLRALKEALELKGYNIFSAEEMKVPSTYSRIEDPDQAKKMLLLIEMLEDHDDIQNIWHNWENEEDYI